MFHPLLWEGQIAAACRAVCGRVQVNSSTRTVVLPKVFETHRDLFPKDARDFLAAVAHDSTPDVQRALALNVYGVYKIKFVRVEWRV